MIKVILPGSHGTIHHHAYLTRYMSCSLSTSLVSVGSSPASRFLLEIIVVTNQDQDHDHDWTEPDGGECDIGGEEEEEADEGKEGDDQGGQVQAWK